MSIERIGDKIISMAIITSPVMMAAIPTMDSNATAAKAKDAVRLMTSSSRG